MSTVQENRRNGYTQMPDEILKLKGLSFRAKCIYCLLLCYARQNDFCYPSHQHMAEDLDTSVDTIQRGLQELKDYGLIEWRTQKNQKPNIYKILPLQKCGIAMTQNCGIAIPQECGTNHTKSKHIIESDEDSSKKPEKEEVKRVQTPPVRKKRPQETKLAYIGKPLTQQEIDERRKQGKNASGISPLPGLIPDEHWQTLEQQSRKAPIKPTGTHFSVCTKKAPIFIDAIIEELSTLLGDESSNTAQNINRAAKLYRQTELCEDEYRALLYAAFDQARRYPTDSIKKKRSDGKANRMPVFFAILEERAAKS